MAVVLSASLFFQYISGISARDFRLTSQAYIFPSPVRKAANSLRGVRATKTSRKTGKKIYLISALSAGLLCAKKRKKWRRLYIDYCLHLIRISSLPSKNKIIMDIILSTVSLHWHTLDHHMPEKWMADSNECVMAEIKLTSRKPSATAHFQPELLHFCKFASIWKHKS